MDEIFMIELNTKHPDGTNETSYHGAFTSFLTASQWLINEGFTPFFNDELSEFLEEETITFECVKEQEICTAKIETYAIQT